MSNARSEAAKARAARLKAKDSDHFKKIARRVRRRGRQASAPNGFAANPAMARVAGAKGGSSRWSGSREGEAGQPDGAGVRDAGADTRKDDE